mgnify:FL=1
MILTGDIDEDPFFEIDSAAELPTLMTLGSVHGEQEEKGR